MLSLQELQQQRKERGLQIVNNKNQVNRIDEFSYTVLSQSGNGSYFVDEDKTVKCQKRDNLD